MSPDVAVYNAASGSESLLYLLDLLTRDTKTLCLISPRGHDKRHLLDEFFLREALIF